MKQKLKKLIFETAIIYTVVLFSTNLVYYLQYGSEANFASGRSLLILPGALFLACATLVRGSEKITAVIKWMLHCVLTVVGIFVFIVLPSLEEMTSGSTMIVGLAGTFLVYLIIILSIVFVINKAKKAKKDNEKYSKKF